ncbi:MAG: hypothetical protein WKF30_07975 [Pyrinomonadaceae bacterium]
MRCGILAFFVLMFASCKTERALRSYPASAAVAVPAALSLAPLPQRELSFEAKEVRDRAVATAARLRGLSFQNVVGMTELTGWEYGTRTRDMAEMLGGDDLRLLAKLAIAGGMLPAGTDLATLASSFAAASAGASYSPFDKQVLLVSRFKDESLITHEYVHALQDQHYDLMNLLVERPFDFDRSGAAFALIEGDAMNVQRRFERKESFERLTLDEIARIEHERFNSYRTEVGALFPPLLTETFIFRYRDGARFVEAVRRDKRSGGVASVFQRPPISTEQVLHPEKYFSNEQPKQVTINVKLLAEKNWQVANSSPLGEVAVKALLMAGLSEKASARGASGWGGDRAFLLESVAGRTFFVWKTLWDNPQEAAEFFQAYQAFAKSKGVVTNSDEGSITIKENNGVTCLVRREGGAVVVTRGNEEDTELALAAVAD